MNHQAAFFSLLLRHSQQLVRRRTIFMHQRQIAYDLRDSRPEKYDSLKSVIDRFNYGMVELWEIRADAIPPLLHAAVYADSAAFAGDTGEDDTNADSFPDVPACPVMPPGTDNIRSTPKVPGAPSTTRSH